MKNTTIVLEIKWYKNDRGGDRRPITIDYINNIDLTIKKNKILNDFKKLPMDIDYINNGFNVGKIPYSVKIA